MRRGIGSVDSCPLHGSIFSHHYPSFNSVYILIPYHTPPSSISLLWLLELYGVPRNFGAAEVRQQVSDIKSMDFSRKWNRGVGNLIQRNIRVDFSEPLESSMHTNTFFFEEERCFVALVVPEASHIHSIRIYSLSHAFHLPCPSRPFLFHHSNNIKNMNFLVMKYSPLCSYLQYFTSKYFSREIFTSTFSSLFLRIMLVGDLMNRNVNFSA